MLAFAVTNSATLCVTKLSFWGNFYYSGKSTILLQSAFACDSRVVAEQLLVLSALSSLVLVFVVYFVIICIATSTATTQTKMSALKDTEDAKNARIASHILPHIHVFQALEPQHRLAITDALKTRRGLQAGKEILSEGANEMFFCVVAGACEIESGEKKIASIKSGQHFGVSPSNQHSDRFACLWPQRAVLNLDCLCLPGSLSRSSTSALPHAASKQSRTVPL